MLLWFWAPCGQTSLLGPVVRRPKPRVKLNPGFFLFLSNAFSRIIFCVSFKSIQLPSFSQKELNWIYFFKPSYLNSNFARTVRYLNLALNNPALEHKYREIFVLYWVKLNNKYVKCMSVFLLECSNFWGSKISSGRLGGGWGVWPKRPADVKGGKSKYVDGP